MRKVSRSAGGNIFVFLVLLLFGLLMFFPFVYSVVQSFKPMNELFQYPPNFFVEHPTLENYVLISQLVDNLWVPFGRYVLNTVLLTLAGSFCHIMIVSVAAFPLAKYSFPGSKLYFEIIVLSLLFTTTVTAIPQYVIMAKTGMIDTYWALFLPPLASSFGLFLMKQFMSSIPDAMLEAASIDGAGRLKTFWNIVMPNVKPAWLTLLIFIFQTYWNGTGATYIYKEAFKPLTTILGQITTAGISRAGVGAAVAVLLSVPPLVLFVLSQSQIVETMAYSGIKS